MQPTRAQMVMRQLRQRGQRSRSRSTKSRPKHLPKPHQNPPASNLPLVTAPTHLSCAPLRRKPLTCTGTASKIRIHWARHVLVWPVELIRTPSHPARPDHYLPSTQAALRHTRPYTAKHSSQHGHPASTQPTCRVLLYHHCLRLPPAQHRRLLFSVLSNGLSPKPKLSSRLHLLL